MNRVYVIIWSGQYTSLRKFSKSSSYLSRFLPPLRGDDKLKSEIDILVGDWLNLFASDFFLFYFKFRFKVGICTFDCVYAYIFSI